MKKFKLIRWLTIATLTLLLYGCSAQWHLRQAIRKDPSIQKITVVKKDTVIITEQRTLVDTLELFKDTVIYKDRVRLDIKYVDKFIQVEAECPSDTVVVTKTVTSTQIEKKDRKIGIVYWMWFFIGGAVLALSLRIIFKIFLIK